MEVKLVTHGPFKARSRRFRYPESPRVSSGCELPPNVPGYQWIIHPSRNIHPRYFDATTTRAMLLLAIWYIMQTLISTDTLTGRTLALVIFVTYETTKLAFFRGQSVECWYYFETKVDKEQEVTK